MKPRIAWLDDEPVFTKSMTMMFGDEFEILAFERSHALVEWLRKNAAELIILDQRLIAEDDDGVTVASRLREQHVDAPIIMMTQDTSGESSYRASRLGLRYLLKEDDMDKLADARLEFRLAIRSALRDAEREFFRPVAEPAPKICPFSPDGGWESRIKELIAAEGPIVLSGEEGAGASTMARWIASEYQGDPVPLPVSLRYEPKNRIDQILYGSVKNGVLNHGSVRFTQDQTLILDGFEKLTLSQRDKLRESIEARQFHIPGWKSPVGMGRRLICLEQVERNSRPTQKLPYWEDRTLRLPPLRQRREDLEFHLRWLDETHSLDGPDGMGRVRSDELQLLNGYPFWRNFYDLFLVAVYGVEATLNDSPEQTSKFDVAPWIEVAKDIGFMPSLDVLRRQFAAAAELDAGGTTVSVWMARYKMSHGTAHRMIQLLKDD